MTTRTNALSSLTARGRTLAVAATAAAALGVTASAASAAPAQNTEGDLYAGGVHVTFKAKRAADAKATSATGSFVAEGPLASVIGLPSSLGSIRLSGPITCLETHGEDVSFFYPFDDKSTSGLLGNLGAGMIVALRKDGSDTYKMGFTPMLTAMVPAIGCDSSLTPLAVTRGGWQNNR